MSSLGYGLRLRELVASSRIDRLVCRVIQRRVHDPDVVLLGERYQLEAVVGRGSHGVVFAAYDRVVQREVALKMFGRGSERAVDEARALARVNHPNVIAVYDVAHAIGLTYLVIELIVGWTIIQRVRMGLDWRSTVALFVAAARGLAAAHQVGVVHGDVKPANILVGRDGSVRVVDFELSRKLEGGSTPPTGTRQYLAPECRAGIAASPYSDQFSFCVALWEALHGRRPDVMSETFETAKLRPRDDVPAQLEHALIRGLATEPGDRHPDMHTLIDELEYALHWGTT